MRTGADRTGEGLGVLLVLECWLGVTRMVKSDDWRAQEGRSILTVRVEEFSLLAGSAGAGDSGLDGGTSSSELWSSNTKIQ